MRTTPFRRQPAPLLLPAALALVLSGCPDVTILPELDIEAPTLEIGAEFDNAISVVNPLPISGKAADNTGVVRLTSQVNGGTEQEVAIAPGKMVEFTAEVPLQLGENTIVLNAYDDAGNRTQVQRKVELWAAGEWEVRLVDYDTDAPIENLQVTMTVSAAPPGSQPAGIAWAQPSSVSAGGSARTSQATLSGERYVISYFIYRGDGSYVLSGPYGGPDSGSWAAIRFSAEGFISLTIDGVTFGPDEFNPFTELAMIHEKYVGVGGAEGVVTDRQTGAPVQGAEVCAVVRFFASPTPPVPCSTTRTNAGGSYALAGLQAGYYMLYVTRPGYQFAHRSIVVLGGRSITDQHLSLAPDADAAPQGFAADFLSTGAYHTCALTRDGVPYCWGGNSAGQLGDGTTALRNRPTRVGGPRPTFESISAGFVYTCALDGDGKAYCWGNNTSGQLGYATGQDHHPTPRAVEGTVPAFSAISAGVDHTCALTRDGKAYCWGLNGAGQLGDGSTQSRLAPAPVKQDGLTFIAISAGQYHTCAVDTPERDLYCWGGNGSGQLGNDERGPDANALTPTRVSSLEFWSSISAGFSHTCAVTTSGKAYCWGDNTAGKLGDGSFARSLTPKLVADDHTFSSIRASDSHTCGMTTEGNALCWGHNASGKLGTGSTDTSGSLTPRDVAGARRYRSISAGYNHTCAVAESGQSFCWGLNTHRQLGDGSTATNQNTPMAVVPPE